MEVLEMLAISIAVIFLTVIMACATSIVIRLIDDIDELTEDRKERKRARRNKSN